jgi:hypothetical protein
MASEGGSSGSARGVGTTRLQRGPPERHPVNVAGVQQPRGGRSLRAVRTHGVREGASAWGGGGPGRLQPWAENGSSGPARK